MSKSNIVIIGGGYGGVAAAQKLEAALHNTHRIILIERKTHYWHAIGAPRTVAVNNFESQLLIPYDNLFKHDGKVIHAAAVRLSDNEVTLDKVVDEFGDKVPFEYAIIATGSDNAKPAKVDGRNKKDIVKEIAIYRNAVKNANKVLIIGGGPVGIELAAEIKTTYEDKKVTVVHPRELLLNDDFPNKFRDQVTARLRALGVNIILNERVQFSASDIGNGDKKVTLVTDKGTKIESDVQLVATGNHVNSGLVSTLSPQLIEPDTGLVKVLPTLQLEHEGYKHIFALGDVVNVKETKMAFRAGLQADVVARNIIALINEKKLIEYKPGGPMMLLTLGNNGGVALLPMFGGILAGNWMVKNLKSKNLFVNKNWKSITGGSPPSLE
ncbi:2791_t:CDS:2 [Paraglomus occultum]|uniref:2791_t:CDS:1 n=1 Tax=Paraglomus occultum TaxID=144539 RepID=A0A9N9FDZ2_9GLOM|nr:2791_t:CDS:2 [Paraglomus occultum]